MNNQEPGFISDQRLRAYYVRIGFITPARNWESELAEYEASHNTPQRRPGNAPNLRIVHAGAGRGR